MGLHSASPCRIAAVLLIGMTVICCALSLGWADGSDAEVIDSGTCGPGLEWEFGDVGDLTITGTGDMDFGPSGEPPWKSYMGWITTVTIGEGVTSIEDNAFEGCTSLFEVIDLSTALDIEKGSADNGYIAYNARNVFQSAEDATIGIMDDMFVYGSIDGYAYLIKFIGESDTLILPEDLGYGGYVICKDFFTSGGLSVLVIPDVTISIEEGAFGDLVFYDEDGVTELDADADNLRGSTFVMTDFGLVKQAQEEPDPGKNEPPASVAIIAGLLSVGIIVYAAYRY